MQYTEVDINDIRQKALKLYETKQKWHYHLLTKDCVFNDKPSNYAILLEGPQTFISYTQEIPKTLSKELAEYLHGHDIVNAKGQSGGTEVSATAKKIIKRAKQLKKEGKIWHHHVLSPGCIFNDSANWQLVFEDKKDNKVYRSFSNAEPKNDLKEIEKLFYSQN